MAFPTTPLIDSGAGSDGTLSGWTTSQAMFDGIYRSGAANAGLTRLTNKFKAAAAAYQLSYRTSEAPGVDCEVFCTVDTKGADGDELALFARMGGGLDSTWAAYSLRWFQNAGNDFGLALQYVLEGDRFPLAATMTGFTYAAGTKMGLEVIGNVLKGYLYQGGSWSQQITFDDTGANVPSAGKMGMEIRNTTARATDFGGGTVSAVGAAAPTNMMLLGVG